MCGKTLGIHTQTKAAPLIPVIRRLEAHRSSGPARRRPPRHPPPRLPGCGLPAPAPAPLLAPGLFPFRPAHPMTRVLPRCPRLPLSPEPARSSAAQRLTAGPEAARPRSRPAPPLPGRSQSGPAPALAPPPARRGASQNPEAWIPPSTPSPRSRVAARCGLVGRKPGPVPQGQPPRAGADTAAVRAGERGSGPAASACLPSCSSRAGRGLRAAAAGWALRGRLPCAAVPAPTPRAGGAVTSRASACVAAGGGRRPRSGAATSVWGGGSRIGGRARAASVPLAGRQFRALPARVQPRLLHPPPRPFRRLEVVTRPSLSFLLEFFRENGTWQCILRIFLPENVSQQICSPQIRLNACSQLLSFCKTQFLL